MSDTIDQAFVDQFSSEIHVLAQQKGSRLEGCVSLESGIKGSSLSVERIGTTEAQQRLTRHADTKYQDTPSSKRWLDLTDWDNADLIDDEDKVRMLIDPGNEYVMNIVNSLNRAKDDRIINALTGTARAAAGSGGNIVLPASQKIVHGSAGLTIAKILGAKQILDENEVDEDEERFFVTTAEQLNNILLLEKVTSADYVQIKALVEGKIDTYLGFKFKRSERLLKTSTTRTCVAWAKSGVKLGTGREIKARVTEMPGKNYSVQYFGSMSVGAVRTEEARVVEVQCTETA